MLAGCRFWPFLFMQYAENTSPGKPTPLGCNSTSSEELRILQLGNYTLTSHGSTVPRATTLHPKNFRTTGILHPGGINSETYLSSYLISLRYCWSPGH